VAARVRDRLAEVVEQVALVGQPVDRAHGLENS
jgi:hypothetical protein